MIDYGSYTQSQLHSMYHLVKDKRIDPSKLVFPVRAGLAAESIDGIMKLLSKLGISSSIFIWSRPHDAVDMERLQRLIMEIGKTRSYVSLPFDIKIGPNYDTPDYTNGGWNADNNGSNSLVTSPSWASIFTMMWVAKHIVC